jgi:hypothetical protein
VSKKRVALLAAVALVLSGSAAVMPQVAKSSGTCSKLGHVVWMKYSYVPAISGACWTLEEPVTNQFCSGTSTTTCTTGTYTFCKAAGDKATLTKGGDEWVYDDTNVNGHTGGSDQHIDATVCQNHGMWTYEFMAALGGFKYAWYPQVEFEENYIGNTFVPYTTSASAENGIPSSPSAYNPVPTLDAEDAAQNSFGSTELSGEIAALCYKAPTGANGGFPPNYYFGFYSDNTVSEARLDNIQYELNQCYH